MSEWKPAVYKDYKWIVADPDLLGGKLTIRDTRLSVSLILDCLANGMTLAEIGEAFDNLFPQEALSEAPPTFGLAAENLGRLIFFLEQNILLGASDVIAPLPPLCLRSIDSRSVEANHDRTVDGKPEAPKWFATRAR